MQIPLQITIRDVLHSDAFEAAKRRLEDAVRLARCYTKEHVPELVGRVLCLFSKDGIGFIAGPDGTEYYFSGADVASPRFEQLREGKGRR